MIAKYEKTAPKPKHQITLELTDEQVEALLAVLWFPNWCSQPAVVMSLCNDLWRDLAKGYGRSVHSEDIGMVDETSI